MAYRPGGVPLGGDRFDRSDIIQVPGGPAPWGQVVRRDDSDDEVDLGSTVSAAGTRFHFGDFDVDSVCQSRAGKIGGGCCCCLFLVLLIMLLSSFKGLHATHFGILRNSLTGVVSYGATYQGGRNFIGFWNDYLIFPATIQSIEWLPGVPQMSSIRDLSPMNVRTADGLMVELGIVTQYQVVRDKIPDIYQTYKTDYEGFFISNLRSALQATVAEFKATELYTKRPQVAESLEKTCRKVCQENLQGFLTCWGIQLLTVSLDPRIESANVQQQVEMQKQATESMKQKAALIRAKTTVLEADFDRQVKLVNVEADAAAVNITRKAKADAEYNLQQARADVLTTIQNTVKNGFAPLSSQELLQYLESNALIENTAGAMIYGDFASATVFANGDNSKMKSSQEL
ncbi:unnamed protein product [Durusdinium trenchii]|uniref:Band 7 domain-containing protein n=1 Tax=Durusdinium trenchii TaxID=1381693 RepID=A0ABP0Q0Y9_9DINO